MFQMWSVDRRFRVSGWSGAVFPMDDGRFTLLHGRRISSRLRRRNDAAFSSMQSVITSLDLSLGSRQILGQESFRCGQLFCGSGPASGGALLGASTQRNEGAKDDAFKQ